MLCHAYEINFIIMNLKTAELFAWPDGVSLEKECKSRKKGEG